MESSFDDKRNAHEEFEALLPWYVSGQISDADREFCDAHAAECVTCREELQAERSLAEAMQNVEDREPATDADAAWTQFRTQLDTQSNPALPKLRGHKTAGTNRWKAPGTSKRKFSWPIAAQVAAAVAVAVLIIPSQFQNSSETFQTLSSSDEVERADANAVVVFQSSVSEREIEQILFDLDAAIVEGPMENGGYLLNITNEDQASVVEELQQLEQVSLAQSLKSASE